MLTLLHLWLLTQLASACGLDVHSQNSPGEKEFYALHLEAALGHFDKAVKDCPADQKALGLRAVTRYDLGKFEDAAADFAELAKHNELLNPRLYLFLALVRSEKVLLEDARRKLAEGTAKLPKKSWPYPIVEAYLGKASHTWPITVSKTPIEMCDAGNFVGQLRLVLGLKDKAMEAFSLAKRECAKDLVEYVGAVEELKHGE